MERRHNHDPRVPIDVIEDEEIGECPVIVKRRKQEIKKIQVKVVKKSKSIGEEEEYVTFQIETDIPLRWVMIGFCQKLGLDFQTTRFEFKSAKLREMDTPHQLGMVHHDVILAFIPGASVCAMNYATLCIRMHKEADLFYNVRRSTAILPQLRESVVSSGPHQGSLSFVYGGLMLTENHTAKELNMQNGDVIDGFSFKKMTSSLRIIDLTLKVECLSGYKSLFRVTKNTRLEQIMDRLEQLHPLSSLNYDFDFRFLFRGKRLEETNTVEEVQLNDGDVIFCVPFVPCHVIIV